SGLRVARLALLVAPRSVLLTDQPELAERLAVPRRIAAVMRGDERIGAVAERERGQVFGQLRLDGPADARHAERRVRRRVGVELAGPVDQTVAARVRVEDVTAGAAEGDVLVRRVRVGSGIRDAAGRE